MSNKQRQLRVSGLDATSNMDVLRQHFERYGPVQTCFMMSAVGHSSCLVFQWSPIMEYIPCLLGYSLPHVCKHADIPPQPVSQSSNQAIVTMKQLEHVHPATQAMDGFVFNGRKLSVM